MNLNRTVLLALAAHLAAVGAAGCKSASTTEAPAGATSAEDTAVADPADPAAQEADPSIVTDVGPTAATDPLPEPPAAKVEEQGPAPSDHHVWLAGYWWWDTSTSAYAWSPGFWQDKTVEATVAPPEPLYEDPGRGPTADYTYVPGYWNWRGSEYVWYHGYWGPSRDGFAYVHPYWEVVGGRWGCSGWGWERYDAGWEGRHAGWEFHGGVWERPAEFRLRVGLAMGHAGDFRVTPGTWHGHVYGRVDVDVHGRVTGGGAAGASMHAGGKIAEPPRGPAAAGHPRMGAPGEPPRAHTGPQPGLPGRPGGRPEPIHAPEARPGEPARPAAEANRPVIEHKPTPAHETVTRPEPHKTIDPVRKHKP